uniref:Uncharacterized protein n=1 Tax=Rhizophora mucronata TaxID=61149 RepID=A0A2P2PQX8_RHIMU
MLQCFFFILVDFVFKSLGLTIANVCCSICIYAVF